MKLSKGFTHLGYSPVTAVAMMASLGQLSLALRTLPLGTAYTIWNGIGAVGAFIVGIAFLGEPLGPMRVCAALLLAGGLVLMTMSALNEKRWPRMPHGHLPTA